MEDGNKRKRENLEEAGLLNATPEQVRDPLFREYPGFFDAHDNLQVRYEMLRSNQIDGESVVAICKRYGVSRQTFYNLQERFTKSGTAGLVPKKSGPRGPSKLTADVVKFVNQHLDQDPSIGTMQLVKRIEGEFGISCHRRTIEKLFGELRSKKNS